MIRWSSNSKILTEARVVAECEAVLGPTLALVPPLPVPLLAVNAAVAREVALGAELVRLVGERALAAHEALHAEGLSNKGGMVVNDQ